MRAAGPAAIDLAVSRPAAKVPRCCGHPTTCRQSPGCQAPGCQARAASSNASSLYARARSRSCACENSGLPPRSHNLSSLTLRLRAAVRQPHRRVRQAESRPGRLSAPPRLAWRAGRSRAAMPPNGRSTHPGRTARRAPTARTRRGRPCRGPPLGPRVGPPLGPSGKAMRPVDGRGCGTAVPGSPAGTGVPRGGGGTAGTLGTSFPAAGAGECMPSFMNPQPPQQACAASMGPGRSPVHGTPRTAIRLTHYVTGGCSAASTPGLAGPPGTAGPPRAVITSLGVAAPGSCAGGDGTVHIHSRSLSRSCVRFPISVSAYENSGDQNRASYGHASMQIPQYMHSEKSMANRSRTLRTRGRPRPAGPPGSGTGSLCESM
jgi:hypothetical protein